jgi:glucose/arabinose dehydrogenase
VTAILVTQILGACGSDPAKPMLPPACATPINGTSITFRFVAETQGPAMIVTSPPDDVRRFVVEQEGRIKIIQDTGLVTFLDITNGDLAAGGEQGLLGLAFHPKYATNGTFFIFYTTSNANVLAKLQVDPLDPNKADPASMQVVFSIPDFASNHNGGMLEFGPDGKLYIGTGDGGGGGDPMKTAQDPTKQLGKILRLDVDSAGAVPENYVLGMRNPWRWSFDRATGDLYIGDVGQDMIEEVDLIPAKTPAGTNLGWSMYEGASCYTQPCDATGKVMPQFTKTHSEGWCSVIGGQVYRGTCYPDAVGKYYFTDYCKHELMSATKNGTSLDVAAVPTVNWIDKDGVMQAGMPAAPASLHEDARGELFLTVTEEAGASSRGAVYHLEAGP